MEKSKIIIGTSSWGSKISYKNSLDIGNQLISMGLKNFDTAPNYGGGYSHHILNSLSKKTNITVDTKYGEVVSPNPKEIFKRIYRYENYETFKKSFKYLQINKQKRKNEIFWNMDKINKYLDFFIDDLSNCKIATFYLHSPPFGILNKNYLKNLNNFLISKKILLGISWPNMKDLDLLIENFPNIKLQLPMDFFFNLKDKILNNFKNVYINSLFKRSNSKNIKVNISDNLINDLFSIIEHKTDYKIVIGVNSNKSIEKLKILIK